jgi:transcription antitermination factor NusG
MPALIQAHESPDTRWFALRVKSRCEKVTAAILHNKGYQEFLPLYRSRRHWSDRTKQLDLPLFPGYVFCRFDPHDRLPVLTTPGLVHIVGVAGIPAPIDDREIDAVHAIIKSGLAAEPWPFVKVGNIVRIDYGSLEGLEGILIEIKKRHRLVVSVTLLQRSVAVEIDRDWVSLVRSTHRPGPPETALRTASVASAQFPLRQRTFY